MTECTLDTEIGETSLLRTGSRAALDPSASRTGRPAARQNCSRVTRAAGKYAARAPARVREDGARRSVPWCRRPARSDEANGR